jgi:uncharacterized protein (DUF427 family)
MKIRVYFHDVVVAETENPVMLEGNVYFPPEDVHTEYLRPSNHRSTCWWKGETSYYHVAIGDKLDQNAAWYYPNPLPEAQHIKNHVAFERGI